ncbi:methylated-DNA--[protein]-cysteine S-methyltransferase [Humibacillus sp. DSM 29435]|uniref:methylated-DNA--[protein]-cysteine S-methyltransferase n=1 Tax=Humibacillus sp. DSM 29435 TaxID=1869167 RepID=UPI0009F2ACF9|nr:methylated-DNA--[protein]-cysteine S-methyltransferase [Humibacillus sp. DSM 29435]
MSDNLIEQLAAPRPADAGAVAGAVAALRERLAGAASAQGLVDVAFRTVETPVGALLLAATEAGVVRVAYPAEGHEAVLESLSVAIGSRVLRDTRRFDDLCHQLDGYFAGQRRHFEVALDLRLAHGFRLEVLEHLRTIAYGATETYAAAAAASGRPKAVRAVGTACATNPLPLLVPCHRVVRSDGTMGGYLGGLPAKQLLLDLEAAA